MDARSARGFLDDAPVDDFRCPACGTHIPGVTVGQLRQSPTLRCRGGHTVKLEASQFDEGVRGVEQRVDRWKRELGS
jgi:hypothetical protein